MSYWQTSVHLQVPVILKRWWRGITVHKVQHDECLIVDPGWLSNDWNQWLGDFKSRFSLHCDILFFFPHWKTFSKSGVLPVISWHFRRQMVYHDHKNLNEHQLRCGHEMEWWHLLCLCAGMLNNQRYCSFFSVLMALLSDVQHRIQHYHISVFSINYNSIWHLRGDNCMLLAHSP